MIARAPHILTRRIRRMSAWWTETSADGVPDRSSQIGWAHRGVRLALYTVILVVALLAFWQAHLQQNAERIRLQDTKALRETWTQKVALQRLGTAVARWGAGPAAQPPDGGVVDATALQQALGLIDTDQQLWTDHFLGPQMSALLAREDMVALRARWRAQDQDLRRRFAGLDDRLPAAQRAAWAAAAGTLIDGMADTLERASVQVQAERNVHAADRLKSAEFSAAFTAGLLVALILLVAEPLVRYVRRQGESLARQSSELQRLALVAERTSNWVAIVDAQRIVIWCNDAFVRGKGVPRQDIIGQRSSLLRPNEHNDADEMGRLHAELDMGLPVRADILHRNFEGRDVWLDVDYQPIHDEAGVLQGFTIVGVDITEGQNQRIRMRTLLDALPVGVLMQDTEGRTIESNAAAAAMLGISGEESGRGEPSARDVVAVRDDLTPYPADERPSSRTLRTGQGVSGESVGVIAPGGDLRWFLVYTQPLRDATDRLAGVVSSMVDVTQQRDQQQLLSLALESASLGVWHWDLASDRIDVNDRLLILLGYQPGSLELSGEMFASLVHSDDLDGWRWAITSSLKDSREPLHWEVRVRHGNGQWYWMLFSGAVVVRDEGGRALRMAGIGYDIHAQKDLEEKLRQSARTDALTHLPNRAELLNRIHASIQRAKQQPGYCFAVLFMDFDRFKQVNDTLGHGVGDELLRQIAQRLNDSLRPGDAFVQTSDFHQMAARIGGDEFVVLLDNIRGDLDAQVVAARLLEILAEPYLIGPHRVSSTASIGIVTTAHMSDDPDSVLRDADIAMYEAKRHGRGRYEMFEPAMRKRVHDDVELENDLRRTLDQGGLMVAYQPVISLASGALTGLEALARWQHPTRGAVSPLVFIPLAEATGLIGRLGETVLRAACHELVRLQQLLGSGAPQSVSVNLSRAQLRSPGFASRVFDTLYAAGLPASALVLEITESLAAQDESMQTVLRELRALGVKLSLDDFGTGYSSLSCLHELPVDQVKIDRSFVSQALQSDYHRVMIEATIRMAQTLGLETVAEGIESQDQAVLMATLGCAKGQGYLYSRPLDVPALEHWARTRAASTPA